jgi:adenine phosphoribosyltransferase
MEDRHRRDGAIQNFRVGIPPFAVDTAFRVSLYSASTMDYKKLIREVPDYPKPGILFYDITTLLKEPEAFRSVINDLTEIYGTQNIAKVVGIESRGFIFGAALAHQLGAGFVPVRRPGKLPADIFEVKYNLEYGSNSLAIHRDAIMMNERVLIVDDLLATGGTAAATTNLVRQLGGEIVGVAFLVELLGLKGRLQLSGYNVQALVQY